jgi:hypothetical protein
LRSIGTRVDAAHSQLRPCSIHPSARDPRHDYPELDTVCRLPGDGRKFGYPLVKPLGEPKSTRNEANSAEKNTPLPPNIFFRANPEIPPGKKRGKQRVYEKTRSSLFPYIGTTRADMHALRAFR